METIVNSMKQEIMEFLNNEEATEIFGQISVHFEMNWYRIKKYDNELYINSYINKSKFHKQKPTEIIVDEFLKWIESNKNQYEA